MRLAVLSDIHGNVPALEAVLDDIERWAPDLIVVNGDLVSRGPCSLRALQLLKERAPAARLLKGNHEAFVLLCAGAPPHAQDPTFDLRRFAHWTYQQLGGTVEELKRWPGHLDLTPGDAAASVHITHGSRLGDRDAVSPATADEELHAKVGESNALFVASHTHKPLLRPFNATLVVNTGSVGFPFDGDPRASYGRFSFDQGRWHGEIARVDFDRRQSERDFLESGFLEGGGPLARLILTEFRQVRGHMGPWMRRYHQAVLDEAITVERAVEEYLRAL